LPPGHKITPKELDDFFSAKELRDLVPKDAKVILTKPIMVLPKNWTDN